MKKIAIIGCGGAGKSTLSKKLGNILQIPVFHLDAIFWKPHWTPIKCEELIYKQEQIFSQASWIIDGNYGSTMDKRLKAADTVIFLHYRTIHCLYGITKRRIQYHGKTRPDMGQDCPEKLDWEFFKWVWRYNKTKAPAIHQQLENLDHTTILIFKSPKETRKFVTTLQKNLCPCNNASND